MDSTTTFKKLVVFDFNLDWKDYSTTDKRYKDLDLVLPLMKQADYFQTVVLSTSGSIIDAIDFMKDKGLNKGFLIASGGAVIYDLAKKQIIYKNCLDHEEVNMIFHHGMMLGLNMIISTITDKYIFVSNSVSFQLIEEKAYSPFTKITSYAQLKEICNRDDIVDIAFVNLISPHKTLKENFNIYKWERFFDNEISDLQVKINQSSVFAHVAKKDSTKLKALIKVMSVTDVLQLSDVLYIAATCVNRECFINFKNSLLANNEDFDDEIKDISKKRHYIAKEINNLDVEFGYKTDSFWK